jgi:uncharacterized protein YqeY
MGMSLKQKISEDTISAMRLKDEGKDRLKTLRLLQAAIKQKEIDERTTLDDGQIYTLLSKMIKQRKDSIDQFRKGHREDLVLKEQQEIDILQNYLPQPLAHDALERIIKEAIDQAKATSIKDMGAVMNQLRASIQGRADMGFVSAKVKELLLNKP